MGKTKAERNAIKSEEEFVGEFLKNSVGFYIKQKNNEHLGRATNLELKQDLKEDLGNLLQGLQEDAKNLDQNKLGKIVKILNGALDSYIDQMDKVLVAGRDKIIKAENINKPNSLQLDKALVEAAKKSDLMVTSETIDKMLSKNNIAGFWKKVSQVFEKLGLNKVADFFKKKQYESKLSPVIDKLKLQKIDPLNSQSQKGRNNPLSL